MEESKRDTLAKIDELLESTSAENRIKFDEDNAIGALSAQEKDEPTVDNEPVAQDIEMNSVADDASDDGDSICIIDETSTTMELTDSFGTYENSEASNAAKPKKKKEKIKFNALQIVLMSVLGVALLWCIVFTVDHTVSAQGYSPIFCVETQAYEDGSASYTGLGYKIQFRFDSSDNLTQKCVPFWKDGPNDIADKQESGASFQ